MDSPEITAEAVQLTKEDFIAGKVFCIDENVGLFFKKEGNGLHTISSNSNGNGIYHSSVWNIDDDGFVMIKWPFQDMKIHFSRCTIID